MQKTSLSPNRTFGPVSDLERHLPTNWWKTLFNSLYLKTDGDVVENNVNTKAEVEVLIDALGLRQDAIILDVCCGQGRHALELARRGFNHVSGIDRSRYLVRLARKRAVSENLAVQFSEGDARKLRFPESSHDAVYLMGNSFGYFEREQDDLDILEAVKRILKSEGKLALDIINGEWMKLHFEKRSWEWIDQNHFVCRERSLSADQTRIISREVIVHAEKGVIADQFYAERLYTQAQIEALLVKAGFQNIYIHTELVADSTRGHDLGMMANRLFIVCSSPVKKILAKPVSKRKEVVVLMGDPNIADSVKKDGKFNEEDFDTIHKLKKALNQLKEYRFRYINNHTIFWSYLQKHKPYMVFNLCDEGLRNKATLELHVPAMLEILDIPYTGAGPESLGLCYNKSITRAIASDLDIPVPEETYYDPSDQSASIPSIFPALLKPNCGDSSIGITKDAVVHNAQQLIAYLDKLKTEFLDVPILIQEYLPGNEYSVGIIGNLGNFDILPILEVDYSALPSEFPPILCYESKWVPESPYWTHIGYKEAYLSEDAKRCMLDYAVRMFERTGCRDYARFDFRMDARGTIKLLEVNPNPGWCWDGKLNLMAEFAGKSYEMLLQDILNSAEYRMKLCCHADDNGVLAA